MATAVLCLHAHNGDALSRTACIGPVAEVYPQRVAALLGSALAIDV
ncbi:hypothetical protein [Polaromonas sp. UBA4122]|nr:hypothetical protein [Polaromonas sp. UBA4122]